MKHSKNTTISRRGLLGAGSMALAASALAAEEPQGRLLGEGRADFPALVGGRGSLSTDKTVLTVGSYWPTATTLFDYIWRGMPYGNPGSLSADETYALTAWVLAANDIVKETSVIDRRSLLRIKMPNAEGFIVDEKVMQGSR